MNDIQTVEKIYRSLPAAPFALYLLNSDGQIEPRKMFTVTRIRINRTLMCVDIYVLEFSRFLKFDPTKMVQVAGVHAN